jgi:hypothetical protein
MPFDGAGVDREARERFGVADVLFCFAILFLLTPAWRFLA